LDHLIHGAVGFREVLVREAEGEVVDDLGFLEGEQSLVISARWEQPLGGMGRM
jgi:hypothetical protein